MSGNCLGRRQGAKDWGRRQDATGALWTACLLTLAAWLPASAALAAGPAATPAAAASAAAGQTAVATGPGGDITQAQLEAAVQALVPPKDRAVFWGSQDAVQRFLRSLGAQQALAARAERAGLQPADPQLTGLPRQQALLKLYMTQQGQAALPDTAAVDRYARSQYQAQPELFVEPAQVRVRHILLAVDQDGANDAEVKARAEKLLAELRAGADFAALAQAESADEGSARRGGELRWFGPGQMVGPFETAAFALQQPGALSEPVKTPFGYHLIELLERKAERKLSFDEALPALRTQILGQIDAQERARLWAEAQAEVEIDEAGLQPLLYRNAAAAAAAAKP